MSFPSVKGIPAKTLVLLFMLGPLGAHPSSSQLPPGKAPVTPSQTTDSGPRDSVVKAEVTDVPFDGFLKYKSYRVELAEGGRIQKYAGGFVHGPGHHISAIAALAFDQQMKPHPILKTGDTRLSRAERNRPYVQDGFIAGRMDKDGYESSKIALAELAEEVGGQVVAGSFQPLGFKITPTMPFESTESDAYFMAAVHITGVPYGDGGGMELTDIIGPRVMTTGEAIKAMDEGEVSESSRSRTMYGRSFDAIGFVPKLDTYVQDHPKLLERFDTLGLGPLIDLRSAQAATEKFPPPPSPNDNLESRVNDVVCSQRREVALDGESRMVDARTHHAVNENGTVTPLGKEFANQYLKLDYDRAKVATYYKDPEKGPMVQMTLQARPALAFAPESPEVMRMDVADLKVPKDSGESPLEGARQLGKPSGASAGQTDLYYQFWAREIPPTNAGEGFVSLAQAIKMCREGQGDSQTEALCERLADDLNWIPNLGMSVSDARKLL